MKLSTKCRYGTRAILDIALNCEGGPVHLRDLAKRQKLSMKYLEQIVPGLKIAGLIHSHRGANGGYTLARTPERINLLEVIEALEGCLITVDCTADPDLCERTCECAVHDVWVEAQGAMRTTLNSITLADLAKQQKLKNSLSAKL
ncbi:MAG: Rrf2 family transcriptional regulator [Rubrobacteridae bacterium]|nr:Rrf2 family transcriptional regulator [Rubrobacteridae bacterium]